MGPDLHLALTVSLDGVPVEPVSSLELPLADQSAVSTVKLYSPL